MSNPYYNPEDFGLTIVDEIEWRDEPYEFDLTVIWKDKSGKYWIADDSGCSCPSPFEDYHTLESLDGPHNKRGIESILRTRLEAIRDERYHYGRSFADLRAEIGQTWRLTRV